MAVTITPVDNAADDVPDSFDKVNANEAAIKAVLDAIPKFNQAAGPPGASNDNTEGYSISPASRWFDTTNQNDYICTDASTGAAVWQPL